MDQVCVLSQFSRVGWEGFNNPPPTIEDVYAAMDQMDPSYKETLKVSILKILSSLSICCLSPKKRTILG